ncbi:DUF6565 domain-containing protein [Hymenobacter psychrophilus]|uniref:Uncharacterized protein n=1 Tax=Hymenobacter psychrophilus TaxID=651662 RepID=A0A1H3BB19_9BACT|nr:DUF6565 domain-containing protein [Hymenobacter psychrophilus]SDX39142.1 hypothetical protein SAMN04488069_101226 [Hymenobacter psychrophilus]
MLRKTLTIPALSALLLAGGMFTQTSCTNTQQTEMAADKDQAYNDFQTFVSDAEARADAAASATEDDYNRETAQMKSDFDSRVAAVDKYADQYDDTRRQEIEQLRNRYTTAYDKREASWTNRSGMAPAGEMTMGKYYKPTAPATRVTAANARQVYEDFVNEVKRNENNYDINDWRNINAEWRALDEAYDKVKGNIPTNDLAEIQKEKLKYAAFKSADKAGIRGGQAVDAVTGEAKDVANDTKDERSAVGQAVSNTASDVKEVGKDVGQGAANVGKKVGGAVKGAYKEVKSEVKNTDND